MKSTPKKIGNSVYDENAEINKNGMETVVPKLAKEGWSSNGVALLQWMQITMERNMKRVFDLSLFIILVKK